MGQPLPEYDVSAILLPKCSQPGNLNEEGPAPNRHKPLPCDECRREDSNLHSLYGNHVLNPAGLFFNTLHSQGSRVATSSP
jgi:hypothetical protein